MRTPPAPTSGDRVNLTELKGALLYFTVKELKTGIDTVHGVSDAVSCDIAVLDGPLKGQVFSDALIFPVVLASQLKPAIGSGDPTVLGVLGQGAAKPGKNAPWQLIDPTPAQLDTGRKYETYAATRAAAQDEPF